MGFRTRTTPREESHLTTDREQACTATPRQASIQSSCWNLKAEASGDDTLRTRAMTSRAIRSPKTVLVARLLDDPNVRIRFLRFYAESGAKATSAFRVGLTTAAIDEYISLYPAFQQECAEAKALFNDRLHRAAVKRGVEGVLEPIHAGKEGELKGYVRKYSDRLLEKLMAGNDRQRYGDKMDIEARVQANAALDIRAVVATLGLNDASITDLESLERLLAATVQHPADLSLAESPELEAATRKIPGGKITGREIEAAVSGELDATPPSQRRGGIDMSLDTEAPIEPFMKPDDIELMLEQERDLSTPRELEEYEEETEGHFRRKKDMN